MKHNRSIVQILYEDDYMFAVNKPPRVASVPGDGIHLNSTVLGMAQRQFEGYDFVPYLLHRLDMPTTGAILFGKHERDREALEGIFGAEETEKKYLTLTKGVPRGTILNEPLKARNSPIKIPAETRFSVREVVTACGRKCALTEAIITTGRKHQIRQHFAGIHCPVVMDDLYGDKEFNRDFRHTYRLGRLFLHAESIKFMHPFLKKIVQVDSPLAIDLALAIKRIKAQKN